MDEKLRVILAVPVICLLKLLSGDNV